MGDASLSSHHFRRAAQLSEFINSAVHQVRKAKLLGASTDRAMIEQLALLVVAIADEVDPSTTPEAPIDIPDAIIDRITAHRSGDAAYLADDLITAAEALKSDTPVNEDVMSTLDLIAGAVDAEASAVFRRMHRA